MKCGPPVAVDHDLHAGGGRWAVRLRLRRLRPRHRPRQPANRGSITSLRGRDREGDHHRPCDVGQVRACRSTSTVRPRLLTTGTASPRDHGHVFSVLKCAVDSDWDRVADGLIADIDQPLRELLPKHREAMSGDTAKVTLRHLMTMSGGFNNHSGGLSGRVREACRSFVNLCSSDGRSSNRARSSRTPMSVLTCAACSRLR